MKIDWLAATFATVIAGLIPFLMRPILKRLSSDSVSTSDSHNALFGMESTVALSSIAGLVSRFSVELESAHIKISQEPDVLESLEDSAQGLGLNLAKVRAVESTIEPAITYAEVIRLLPEQLARPELESVRQLSQELHSKLIASEELEELRMKIVNVAEKVAQRVREKERKVSPNPRPQADG